MTTRRKKIKTQKKTPTKKTAKKLSPLAFEIIGIISIGLSLMMIFQLGPVGRFLTTIFIYLVGIYQFLIPLTGIILSIAIMIKRQTIPFSNRYMMSGFLFSLSLVIFAHQYFIGTMNPHPDLSIWSVTWQELWTDKAVANRTGNYGGGLIGAAIYGLLYALFDRMGTVIIGIILVSTGCIILTGKTLMPLVAQQIVRLKETSRLWWEKRKKEKQMKKRVVKDKKEQELAKESIEETVPIQENLSEAPPIISGFRPVEEKSSGEEKIVEENEVEELEELKDLPVTKVDEAPYQIPSIELLQPTPYVDQSEEFDSIQSNAQKLEATLKSFGVQAKVVQVHMGPAVTKYELLPDTGVKVSRIVSLTDDIALALAATGIRIEAPIPGKSAIGIEVPNQSVAMVGLREVLEKAPLPTEENRLLVALGRDVTGEAVLAPLNKMPHVLVAGSTGSGKSVCINSIIMSLLLRTKPHEVKLMMIDPKMVELTVYNGVPHLLTPVVTNPRKAAQALQKVVGEMERRYELFSHTGTRNIEGYNAQIKKMQREEQEKTPSMPYIVVIVDELADLMMVASSEVEDAITRLAQMARAAGIHLVIATQRPSVDVITGIIKANIPSRIAFAVSSSVDSRTILDGAGAEKLLGRGDMLYLHASQPKPVRVQGAFVTDEEVEVVVEKAISQQQVQYEETMIPDEPVDQPIEEETDELFEQAVELVIDMQTASVSFLQRRFRIGYSRAARIIDQMEMRGIVGPPDGSRPRTVLVLKEDEKTE